MASNHPGNRDIKKGGGPVRTTQPPMTLEAMVRDIWRRQVRTESKIARICEQLLIDPNPPREGGPETKGQ